MGALGVIDAGIFIFVVLFFFVILGFHCLCDVTASVRGWDGKIGRKKWFLFFGFAHGGRDECNGLQWISWESIIECLCFFTDYRELSSAVGEVLLNFFFSLSSFSKRSGAKRFIAGRFVPPIFCFSQTLGSAF